MFELFVSLFGALTFGNDRDINAEVAAIKFVLRGACITYKNKESSSSSSYAKEVEKSHEKQAKFLTSKFRFFIKPLRAKNLFL